MIYIYAPDAPAGTTELVKALNAKLLLRHDGYNFVRKGRPIEFGKNDAIVCWGRHVPPVANAIMLNASYRWVNQLSINKNLAKICAPYTAFELTEVGISTYNKELQQAREHGWVFRSSPASGLVMLKEFEGYGIRYYAFPRRGNMHLFNGGIVQANSTSGHEIQTAEKAAVMAVAKQLDLDFCKISYGMAQNTLVILKILTAPVLNAELVDLYARNILSCIEIKRTKANNLNDMLNLLEG